MNTCRDALILTLQQDHQHALENLRLVLQDPELLQRTLSLGTMKEATELGAKITQYLSDLASSTTWAYPQITSSLLKVMKGNNAHSLQIISALLIVPVSHVPVDDDSGVKSIDSYKTLIDSLMEHLHNIDIQSYPDTIMKKSASRLTQIISSQCFHENTLLHFVLSYLKTAVVSSLGSGNLASLFNEEHQEAIYKELLRECMRGDDQHYIKDALKVMGGNKLVLGTLLQMLKEKKDELLEACDKKLDSSVVTKKFSKKSIRGVDDEIEEEGDQVNSQVISPLQNITMLLEISLSSFPSSSETNYTNINGDGDENGTGVDFSGFAAVLFKVLSTANSSQFDTILSVDYTKGLVLNHLLLCFNARTVGGMALFDLEEGSRGVREKESTAPKKRSQKKSSVLVNPDASSSDRGGGEPLYNLKDLRSDVEQIIIILQSPGTSSQTRNNALHLLQVLSPLIPDSILPFIQVLGELISSSSKRLGDGNAAFNCGNEREKSIVNLLLSFNSLLSGKSSKHQLILEAFYKKIHSFSSGRLYGISFLYTKFIYTSCLVHLLVYFFYHIVLSSIFTCPWYCLLYYCYIGENWWSIWG